MELLFGLHVPVLQLLWFPLLPSQLEQFEQFDPDRDDELPLPSLEHLAIATSSWLFDVGDA